MLPVSESNAFGTTTICPCGWLPACCPLLPDSVFLVNRNKSFLSLVVKILDSLYLAICVLKNAVKPRQDVL